MNGNRTSDTRYGQQVTTQELTGYDESGSPIVTSSYANRTGVLIGPSSSYSYDALNRVSTVANQTVDANGAATATVTLDTRAYDGAGHLSQNGPGNRDAAFVDYVKLLTGEDLNASGIVTRTNQAHEGQVSHFPSVRNHLLQIA